MSKDISAAKEGIRISKFKSRGIQVHPVNEKREQNLLNSRSLEPAKFIPKLINRKSARPCFFLFSVIS